MAIIAIAVLLTCEPAVDSVVNLSVI
jgi:hypothetical protein